MFRPSAFSVITAFFVSVNLPGSPTPATRATGAPVDQIITWLLDEDRQLREIPFAEVIFDATGKRVLPMDSKNEIDQRVIKQISAACDETVKRFNAPDSAALPANMVTLYNTLIAAWPTAVFCWIKINADTINFPIRADTYTNQATGFTSLPLVKQIWCDDQIPALGIESDHAHLTPNGLRVYGTRALFQGLDALNYARTRPAAVPALVGDGYVFATDGTGAPTSDGAPIAFDEELLIKLDMLVGGAYVLNTTPAGWTSVASLVSNSGVGVGCRLTIYKRLVDEAMLAANHRNTAASSVALDVPCTRLFTKILTYRGSNAASAPTVAQTASAGVAGNTSSYAGPSLTTGGTNRRVVCITMGFISASLATTVTLTGLTSGTVDRNSVVITPGTAACLVDIQSAVVPTAATINITNVATSRTITSPVTFLVELAS